MSQALNYNAMPRQAVAARNYRIQITSKSGTSFTQNQSFQIELPTIARTYADLANMYLTFDLQNESGNAEIAKLNSSAYDLISRMTVSSGGGAIVDDAQHLNRYYAALLAQSVSHEFRQNFAAECIGHAGQPNCPFGINVPAANATPKRICIPLLHSVATANKMLPLSTAQGLNFTFYLESAATALFQLADAADVPNYKISNPALILDVTELSPETEQLIQQSVGTNGFNLSFTGLASTIDTKSVDAGQHIVNLGFRYSSLNKITLLMFDSSIKEQKDQLSTINRSWSYLSELSYFVNGVRYPGQKLLLSENNFSEALTETLKANKLYTDVYHNSHLNYTSQYGDFVQNAGNFPANFVGFGADVTTIANMKTAVTDAINAETLNRINAARKILPVNGRQYEHAQGKFAADSNANTTTLDTFQGNSAAGENNGFGSFVVSYSFESFKTPADDSMLMSGISTLGANVTAEMAFASNTANPRDLYFYAEYNKILSIDPLTLGYVTSD